MFHLSAEFLLLVCNLEVKQLYTCVYDNFDGHRTFILFDISLCLSTEIGGIIV